MVWTVTVIFQMLKTQTRWKVFGRSVARDCSKPRVVVLGAGWGGFRVARDLDKNKFDVTVVSPRCDHPYLVCHDH